MTDGFLYKHTRIEAPCCGPFAIHVATGLPYGTVMAVCQSVLGKRCNWHESFNTNDMERSLDALGVEYIHSKGKHGSLIEECWPGRLDPTLPVIFHIPRHFVTLFNGQLIDQTTACEPFKHWTRFKYTDKAIAMLNPPAHEEGLI